ncbi:MAG: hypothetical protein ACM3U2_12865, partial [Deltaproteobacteria bacterium]
MPVCLSRAFPFRFLAGFILAAAAAWWPGATAAAADDVKGPQVEYSAIHAASGGVNTYVPGKWGILNLEVTNPLQQPHELLSTTYFDGHATLQFGRRIWLPARSRLRIGQPLLSPDLAPEARDRFEFHSLVLDAAATNVVAARDDTGQILHSGILPAQLETPITGLIDHLGESFLPEVDKSAAYDLAVAARLSDRKSTRLARLEDRNYAPDDVSLQSLHQLVVADSRALDDPAGLAAIRRWVHGGGRLWVMLDRVDPRFLERILGDEFLCEVVDRVGLTSVRIEAVAKERFSTPVESEHEQPVDLVRVVATGANVTYTVNGWPAALWKPLGAGKILVTTLGPRGWMRLRTAEDDRSSPTGGRFVLLPPMAEIAKAFLVLPAAPLKISQIFEPQTVEYIGYSIPPRWLIASLLAGVVAAVVVLGLWLLRRGALEYLGWISSGLAVCVAVALLVIGGLNRHTISATAAAVAFTEAIAGTDDVRTRGAVALYNPESAPGTLGATRGGRLSVDMSGLEGTTRRMVWTDLDTFHWEHLALGGGQRVGTFEQSA